MTQAAAPSLAELSRDAQASGDPQAPSEAQLRPGGQAHASQDGPSAELSAAKTQVEALRARLRAVIAGRDEVIDWVLVALLADGHVLLEDYPGSGKTTLAKALGAAIHSDTAHPSLAPPAHAAGQPGSLPPEAGVPDAGQSPWSRSGGGSSAASTAPVYPTFRRIQFTPDLLPSDITGTTIFDIDARTFSFRPGPVFAHVVLADEINRTSPKVQSALLEAMGEKQVTVDNETHALDELFFVIATQNPVDLAGTYPLPTPQLDRFLFKLRMEPIASDPELALLKRYPTPPLTAGDALPTVARSSLLAARRALREQVFVDDAIRLALVRLAHELREDARTVQGPSTRALLLALPALQARALLQGRDYVAPQDVEDLALVLFPHRIVFRDGPDAALEVLADHVAASMERLARLPLRPRG